MGIFDSHAHYFPEDFGEELYTLLDTLGERGVDNVLAIGDDLETSRFEISLAERYERVWAAAGIHPEKAASAQGDWENELRRLLSHPKVKALGEIGLDYHWPEPPHDVQKAVFERQLAIAAELDLPVVIHCREATEDTMELLRRYKPRGVMHCFSGSAETAEEVVKLGLYIGFTGVLTFKNSKKAKRACAAVPTQRLLLETDSPYMAPEPHRGEKSESSMIRFTAAAMAEIKGVSSEEMLDITARNARRLFGIGERE